MSDETSVVRTIGRYHAVDELGRGGMGIVYRGFDPVIGRTVALKTIGFVSADAEAKTLRERLYREASAAGTLTHPNIVTVYDVIEDGATT
ncbi:MAG: serine/threonine protein kinase, partial [Acidobacteria bacterium]|nr:serine/threonine protein kinase [Acidobacteriota bacterium]